MKQFPGPQVPPSSKQAPYCESFGWTSQFKSFLRLVARLVLHNRTPTEIQTKPGSFSDCEEFPVLDES
jgi:hypothetical protein